MISRSGSTEYDDTHLEDHLVYFHPSNRFSKALVFAISKNHFGGSSHDLQSLAIFVVELIENPALRAENVDIITE